MFTEVHIRGVGPVGGFGCGFDALQEIIEVVTARDPEQPAGTGPILADISEVERFRSAASLRRTDHFSRLALLASYLALEHGGLPPDQAGTAGLILCSGYGPVASTCAFKDSYLESGPLAASPLSFTRSVQNQAAAHLAMHLAIHGPVTTICQHLFPFQTGLQLGCCWLDTGVVENVLVIGVDEYPPFLDYCRRRFFEDGREGGALTVAGMRPGEGAACFLLAREGRWSQPRLLDVALEGAGEIAADTVLYRRYSAEMSGELHSFGAFPTAAALDLAMLVALADQGGGGLCLEEDVCGRQSVIRISGGFV